MNFLIFRDFFRFCEFNFILNLLKTIKKILKRGFFCAGPTCVRRGAQGHVAEPRGPTRAPAWRGGDTRAIFIFTRMILGYCTYKHLIVQI